jgi:glycerol-3-phosphate dehydrogenase
MKRRRDQEPEKSSLVFSPKARQCNLDKMGREDFDVLAIGGGITGAGIARDAVLRGFRTALIEKDDFGSGTSSKSSKLVHGGFRYLKQLQFGLVHEALTERKILRRLAPHLVYPMRCLLPLYQDSATPAWVIQIGMWLYDILALDRNIRRHRMISAQEIQKIEPAYRQEGLRKAAEYYDCWGDDFRLVMATLKSAAQYGAVSANHVRAVDGVVENRKIIGVLAKDQLSGKDIRIKTRVVANATGPWSDQVRDTLFGQGDRRLRLTKGVHIIVPLAVLPVHSALMQFAIRDGRPIFAIPWKDIVILGTTDTDYHGDPDRIGVDRTDVDYLLESFNHYFPGARLTCDHVLTAFAGLRPLVFEPDKSASQVTREYQVFEGPENFFTMIGGKLTTYRRMAEKLVDRLAGRLAAAFDRVAENPRSGTDRVPLWGGEIQNYKEFQETWISRLAKTPPFDRDMVVHLIERYGAHISDVLRVIEETPDGGGRIHPQLPYVWGELCYAIDHEMAVGLDDFLIRRAPLFSQESRKGGTVYQEVADRMQKRLGWSPTEKKDQIDRYERAMRLIEHFRERGSHENKVYR